MVGVFKEGYRKSLGSFSPGQISFHVSVDRGDES